MRDTAKYIKDSLASLYPEAEIKNLSRIVIEHIAQQKFSPLLLDDFYLSEEQKDKMKSIVERLKKSEPIQYIIGECEFYSLPFLVNKDVLIPRPETEELVELILNDCIKKDKLNILDIGTGSGCIAVSLAANLPQASVEGWDISPEALSVARRNAERNKVNASFVLQDILKDISTDKKHDIIVSNPPYVLESEKEEMAKNVLDYEPHLALFVPNDDGLVYYNRIADIARHLLVRGGMLYFEINREKGDETNRILEKFGFSDIQVLKDINKNNRMVKAKYLG